MSKPRIMLRFKLFLIMLFLMILDIGPVPITASIGIYIVLFRPHWFIKLADKLYGRSSPHKSTDSSPPEQEKPAN
jgi:hypothetical protein